MSATPPAGRNFPDFIQAYMGYSGMSEAPDAFHFWTAVSIVAGAIRRRCLISKITGYFEWVPNFYIVFVGSPGVVNKSSTANIGMALLQMVPDIFFGPSIITWQALVQKMGEAQTNIEFPNGDIDVMSAMTISSAELGNLLNPKDPQMVDLLVDLWDSRRGALEKVTKTMGDDKVQNPWINVLGCTTPEWISGSFPEYMIGGGFMSRCIFVYGEKKRKLSAYPGASMTNIKHDLNAIGGRLIEDLTAISKLQGEFTLTPEAIAWGEAWYKQLNEVEIPKNTDMRMSGYLARKQTHLHKLAMVVSAARRSDLVIDVDVMRDSLTLLEAAEKDIPKVFNHIGMSMETRAIDGVVRRVRQAGKISISDLYREFCRQLTNTQFKEVVTSACATGQIRSEQINGGGIYLLARD